MERVIHMKSRNIAVCAAFAMLLAAAVRFHGEISESVISAGNRCILLIIPSLYLFSVLASLCIRSGVLEILAAPLDGFGRKCLHMDGILFMILLFSQTAGYPIGTQLLHRMQQKGLLQREQEHFLLCVCVGCGPAFLLGTVGGILRLSPKLAALLMLSVVLPNFLLAVVFALLFDFRSGNRPEPKLSLTSAEFVASVDNGASAMLKICSMILVFGALMGIAEGSGALWAVSQTAAEILHCPPVLAESWFAAFLEISNLTEFLRQGGSLPWAAALLSFGGICVHMQNAAICGGEFPWLRFWGIRLLTAVSSYFLCSFAIKLVFRGNVHTVLLCTPDYVPEVSPQGVMPVLCLLIMSVLLLMRHDEVHRKKIYTKRNHNLQRYN